VKTTDSYKILRENYDFYTSIYEKSHDPSVEYNGGYEADEDPADYIIIPFKAVKLA
jgi:hypothetical protein